MAAANAAAVEWAHSRTALHVTPEASARGDDAVADMMDRIPRTMDMTATKSGRTVAHTLSHDQFADWKATGTWASQAEDHAAAVDWAGSRK
jgi:hypothetical protein